MADADVDLFGSISDDDAQRVVEIYQRWEAYEGKHPASLQVPLGDFDDNLVINNAAELVDVGADFLFPKGVELHVAENDKADERLQEILKQNRKETLLRKLGVSGAVAGHFFIRFIPAGKPMGEHRIRVLDPSYMLIATDPDDYEIVVGYSIQYPTLVGRQKMMRREDHLREQVGTTDDGQAVYADTWTITRYSATDNGLGINGRRHLVWTMDGEPQAWPYPWCQIVDGQNMVNPHESWGRSDIERDVMHLNEAVNAVTTNTNKTLRLHAHPQTVFTSDDVNQARGAINDASIGEALVLPTGSTAENLEIQSEGLTTAHTFACWLNDKQFEMTRTPQIAAGKIDNIGALSGVALLVLYRPLVAKTETKQSLYGPALEELCEHILEYDGFGKDIEVAITWPDVVPKNEAEEVATGVQLQSLGVSQTTLLTRLGFDPDAEAELRAEEALDPTLDAHGANQQMGDMQAQLDSLHQRMSAIDGASESPNDDAPPSDDAAGDLADT